ncbi:MAG: sulfotransferase domain-containing protein [Gammaproteobacteria bacterium]|nr:sulfotransferase domain-containing protein [Gammaproteobacteria bacterium]
MTNAIGKLKYLANQGYRRVTVGQRDLPSFIIAGTQKGGTSSLYSWMASHPQVRRGIRKELHYFNNDYGKGLRWYRAQFPRLKAEHAGDGPVMTGEATPCYMFHPHAPRRIAADLPGVKLIILLRNPVERAYSHYQMAVRMGRETLSFEDAIRAEPLRLAPELAKMAADPAYCSTVRQRYSYTSRGIYVDQLLELFCHFENDRVRILKSEAFFAAPQAAFDEVTRFLGLSPWKIDTSKIRNRGGYSGDISGRAELEAFFAPHNRRLYELLDTDFGW